MTYTSSCVYTVPDRRFLGIGLSDEIDIGALDDVDVGGIRV